MRKFLHMAGGIAKKTLATAAKLAKKLAHIVLQAAGAAVSTVGRAVKGLLGKAACRRGQKGTEVHSAGVQGRDDRVRARWRCCPAWAGSSAAKNSRKRNAYTTGRWRRGSISLKQSPAFPRTAQGRAGESKGDLSKYEEKGIQSGEQTPAGPDDQFHLHPQGDIPAGDHL